MDSLISRQAAIDALNEYFARIGKLKRRGLTKGEKAISLDTVGAIKTLPPAQRKGEWIAERYMDEVDSCFYTRYKCSECGRIVYDSSLPYCHCGAEMVIER